MKKEITIQLCLLGAALLVMLIGVFLSSPMRAVPDERLLALLKEEIVAGERDTGLAEPEDAPAAIEPALESGRETNYESPGGIRETTY